MHPPLLISLPHGLNASGITLWAVRLVNALAGAGRACALVVHDEPFGQRPIGIEIDPRVEVLDARGLPPLDACDGDLSPYLPVYRVALGILATRAPGSPVVCAPSILGDSFGVFAELTRRAPDLLRVLAVHHSDTPYNDLVCIHYAPIISAFVGVSDRITERLRGRLSTRAASVFGIAYGVETPSEPALREPLRGRPVRLVYSGRMDHEQKRVRALVALADELTRRGIDHELALIGDGPAAEDMDALIVGRPAVRRFGALPPAGVAAALDRADFFVLPSRYEGLSVAMLEAVGRGSLPILTPSESGAAQVVRDGATGFIAGAGPEASEQAAGVALADALGRALSVGDEALERARAEGHATIRGRFSSDLCAARYAAVIDHTARGAPRAWPIDGPAAFTGCGGQGSGTVPADAAERLRAALAALAGRPVAIYGTGRHTLELREVFEQSPATIVAFLDDDAARQGATLWGVPITSLQRARDHGATDIVVSSWLHQDALIARCVRHGLGPVHTLYAPPAQGASASEPHRSVSGVRAAQPIWTG